MVSVPVYDLAQNTNGIIFAGTHGRGAFRLVLATATPTPTATPTSTATATATVTTTPTGTPSADRDRDRNGHRHRDRDCDGNPNYHRHRDRHSDGNAHPDTSPEWSKNRAPVRVNLGSSAIGNYINKSFSIKNSGKGNLIGNVEVFPPSPPSAFGVNPPVFNISSGASVARDGDLHA